MALWFECKVGFDKMMENGSVKKVTESYLVDALSFTEAEARIIEECNHISAAISAYQRLRKPISRRFSSTTAPINGGLSSITSSLLMKSRQRNAGRLFMSWYRPTGSYRHFQQRHEGNYGRLRDRKGCRDKNHRYLSGKAVFNKWNGKS